jgi:hypothetical protein
MTTCAGIAVQGPNEATFESRCRSLLACSCGYQGVRLCSDLSYDLKVRSKPDSLSMINGFLKERIVLLFRSIIELKKLSYVAQIKLIAA